MNKLVLMCTAAILAVDPSQGALLYRSSEGWTIEGDPANQTEAKAVEELRKAEEAEKRGDTDGAVKICRNLVKRYPTAAAASRAQRKIGTLLEKSGAYDPAFVAYETYLLKFPNGADFEGVVEGMYRIGKLFLDGQKKKVLGLSIGSSTNRAREMFDSIVKKAPYSNWAALSQFNIGQCHEKQREWAEAIVAYKQVVSRYPTDGIADDAQYQIGFVLMTQANEGSRDQESVLKARESFDEFINRYPQSEKVAQAKDNLTKLSGGQTNASLDIAKYYDKTKNYKAAVIYYNDVIKSQPSSPAATFAKTRIDELKQQVGEDALRAGPERAETGARASARRKLQAKVDTVSRPDYVGPPIVMPPEPDEIATPNRPKMRGGTGDLVPLPPVEPPLPSLDPSLPSPQNVPDQAKPEALPPGEAPLTPDIEAPKPAR